MAEESYADIVERQITLSNDVVMNVAELGNGKNPMVLFVHGFPECWYSWRHQMRYLAKRNYYCVAPDMRGYGDTKVPDNISKTNDARWYTYESLVGDLVALLDSLAHKKVYLVGHDWGALIAWWFCIFRPDRVQALVNTSVAFYKRGTQRLLDILRDNYGPEHYTLRFQEPGEMEEEIEKAGGPEIFLRIIYALRDPGPLLLPKDWYRDVPDWPKWLNKNDQDFFIQKFKKSGFTGPINYYRALNINWDNTTTWMTRQQVNVPTKFIVGDQDLAYDYYPGMKEYINNGGLKADVPNLEPPVILEGVAHFLQQESPDIINEHIFDFIKNYHIDP